MQSETGSDGAGPTESGVCRAGSVRDPGLALASSFQAMGTAAASSWRKTAGQTLAG